ncbi:toll/interleukin-1 receptor domain-containing protein [Pedobacter sp. MC2016-14]|uniref:toll/interleukin-1 receptor domain-containing protein n=1 Tax=Pedobacter sp. MC2016-14 TaxID=2897327 RepID=UPI001E4319E7|nr:toll/interleukin-1 receptor domain-containing protein [Pedobacter sp. MC2016-14]MCD0488552.1 toll/interleukin-1 receptor domain-containing protein [Pedobacter sp. MC2016-14]
MRDTIFISHATPEDNEFTVWLASRLELLGYKVWIDKKELLGGETFWETIESVIKINAVKFLLVYSKNICYPDSEEIKGGIQKEIDFAKDVIKNETLNDFFIILHMDDSGYNLFPGAKDLNQIPFNENWAEGLTALQKKLVRDNVPVTDIHELDEAAKWYLNNYLVKNPIIEKKELYYTNWWSVKSMPKSFFIMRYKNEKQANKVAADNENYLLVKDANCVTTFNKRLHTKIIDSFGNTSILPYEVFEITISELLQGYEKESFPSFRDAENHFKKLFKRTLHLFFKNKQLYWYDLSNKNMAYYHTYTSLPTSKVTFDFPYRENARPKTKNLLGKHLEVGKWHFAISAKPALSPFLGFHLRSHLIFTKSGYGAIDDKDLQHTHRRKKGKRMFNEEWRDLLLAFIKSLGDSEGEIILKTGTETDIVMKPSLEMFWSDYGYFDPKDLKRQELFIDDEREDFIQEQE